MTRFYCPQILLSDGWAENQLLEVDGLGSITGIRNGSMKEADHHLQGPVVPGMPNLHSHAFQRGMAGLSESRSGEKDSFWSWRKRMYHFLQVLSPEDVEAIASQLYLEMLKAGYTSVGEFHYLHHDVDGKHYANPAEMSERILAASETTGIGLTHLRCCTASEDLVPENLLPNREDSFMNRMNSYICWRNSFLHLKSIPTVVWAWHPIR